MSRDAFAQMERDRLADEAYREGVREERAAGALRDAEERRTIARAEDLAREAFDNTTPAALEWIEQDATQDCADDVAAVVAVAAAYCAHPDFGRFSKLMAAVAVVRAAYVSERRPNYDDAATAELAP